MIEYNELLNEMIFTKLSYIVSFRLFLFIIIIFILSILIDVIFGELPGRIHPVVIIGSLISFFKGMFIKIRSRISGLFLIVCVVAISMLILYVIYMICSFNLVISTIVFSILLSSTYSVNMLLQTAVDVKKDLDEDIDKARKSVSYLVSRNTEELTESFIVSAVIESLTENITDSYVAPFLYYFAAGLLLLYLPSNNPIYLLLLVPFVYRIFNTMDAMVGYETDELKDIGFMPAKIDDILNYVPSRLAGIFVVISSYLLNLNWKNSYRIMRRDARNCPSPNSGFTMASTAGALDIQLIKKGTYILGDDNKDINADDIAKAVSLSKLTIILFSVTVIVLFILIYVIL